jgi:hypothetical protein
MKFKSIMVAGLARQGRQRRRRSVDDERHTDRSNRNGVRYEKSLHITVEPQS